ncbi:antitoxin VapB [Rhizobium aquaticum]|uniref:Antitoxin VapB n=1 Tax=Rhizobium aquaticum TaxID=1549636 RepID=A0ABV2IZG9_9HYPH
MGMVKHAKVFKNGRNRAIRIPVEFEFPGDDVTITKQGRRIIIEPVEPRMDLLEWLKTIEPWDEEFPDIDEGLPPPDDVEL